MAPPTKRIEPTRAHEKIYGSQIQRLAIDPLRRDLVKALAKIPADHITQPAYRKIIDDVFFDPELEERTEEGAQIISTRQVQKIDAWQRRKFKAQVEKLIEIDVVPYLKKSQTITFLDPIVDANVALIRSISPTLHSQIIEKYNNILRTEGFNQASMAKMLSERFGVAQSRANLIASDQTGKTVGALTKLRQTQAGFLKFVWRTSRDPAVRPEHRVLEGRVFLWSAPPSVGIPGQPINCRCTAEPYIEGITENVRFS